MLRPVRLIVIFIVICMFLFSGARLFAAGSVVRTVYENDYIEHFGFRIPDKGCALFIDLDICTMIVYRDGSVYKAYPVSGGTVVNPSPTGSWHITSVSQWGEGFGGSWIGLNVPWGKYGIHGTVQPWALGESNVSHGCIRMRDEDVSEVRRLVSVGSLVYIKNDTMPFRAMKNGMVGSDVRRVQKMLGKLGFYYGSFNGIFGNGTEAAVRHYQKANYLYQDGIVGRETYKLISRQYLSKPEDTV
jgi:hypothetical protein